MKFTEEFKKLINKVFEENDADCIQLTLEEEENHDVVINLGLVSTKEVKDGIKEIDGMKVLADDEVMDALEGAVFSADEDGVVIELEHCGCEDDDCDCHHHHHEGECCEDDDCCCKKDN